MSVWYYLFVSCSLLMLYFCGAFFIPNGWSGWVRLYHRPSPHAIHPLAVRGLIREQHRVSHLSFSAFHNDMPLSYLKDIAPSPWFYIYEEGFGFSFSIASKSFPSICCTALSVYGKLRLPYIIWYTGVCFVSEWYCFCETFVPIFCSSEDAHRFRLHPYTRVPVPEYFLVIFQ